MIAAPVFGKQPGTRQTAPGSYQNPVLFADYSDPDVIRDGANFYLVASTFEFVPGIPILQSQQATTVSRNTSMLTSQDRSTKS